MDPALQLLTEGDPDDEVAVIIRRTSPESVLPDSVRIIAEFGTILTCRLRRQDIVPTRLSGAVESVKAPVWLAPERVYDESDAVEPEHHSVIEHPATPLPTTGKGTVIGIVDWGCDFAHASFRNSDGSTRLLAIWDQTAKAADATANIYGYGRVITREEIDRALRSDSPYETLGYHPEDGDPDKCGSHGTHVLSIAAGTAAAGRAGGIAPDAELVFVHFGSREGQSIGDSVCLLEAFDFLSRRAGERPLVINLSLGRHGGPHDGSTLVELAIDFFVNARPGRAVVQSAGNYFSRQVHGSGRVRPNGCVQLSWEIDPQDRTPNELDLWYSGRDRLQVEIIDPSGTSLAKVGLGDHAELKVSEKGVGRIFHRQGDPNNGDNQVAVYLDRHAPQGEWQVRLRALDIVDGRFHAWIERDLSLPGYQSRFTSSTGSIGPSHTTTTGTICNGLRSITVGAYDAHSARRLLPSFSSSGPTRDGRVKPELVAPGVRILAARSASREANRPSFGYKSGTSMAAPHVTGTIACLFEAAGRQLAIDETRRILLTNADPVESDDEDDDSRVGSGYLNSSKSVAAAPSASTALLQAAHAAPSVTRANELTDDDTVTADAKDDDKVPLLMELPNDHQNSYQVGETPLTPNEGALPIDTEDIVDDDSLSSEMTEDTIMANYDSTPGGNDSEANPDNPDLEYTSQFDAVQPVDESRLEFDARFGRVPANQLLEEYAVQAAQSPQLKLDARWLGSALEAVGTRLSHRVPAVGAAQLFDSFTLGKNPALAAAVSESFSVIGMPGQMLDGNIVPGCMVLSRGEAGMGTAEFITEYSNGSRWIDSVGRVSRHTLILRPSSESFRISPQDQYLADEQQRLPRPVDLDDSSAVYFESSTDNFQLSKDDFPDFREDGASSTFTGPVYEDELPCEDTPNGENPFATWATERDSLVLMVADDKLYVIPSAGIGTIVPPERLRNIDWRQVIVQQELGPKFGLPAVGAGASRVVKAGPRLAVMLDVGRNPQRQPAAVYMPQLLAIVGRLNITEIRALILIHRHTDHINELPRVVQQFNISAQNVVLPRAFINQIPTAIWTATLNALRQRFGANWQPTDLQLRPATPSGDLVRGRFTLSATRYEFLGLSAALRARQHSDSSSLLTRIVYPNSPNPHVVLGDLRGVDLAEFHRLMTPQAWNEFFANVRVIDGFSHHGGAMTRQDVPGIMRLLEATLLRYGKLVVTLQTDPGQHSNARADTLELMRRIGIEVHETHVARTTQPSNVTATPQGARSSGPDARSHQPHPQAEPRLTEAFRSIEKLVNARATIELWGPHLSRLDPNFNTAQLLQQIDQSLNILRRAAGSAVEAAANVRTTGERPSGGRSYSSGTLGAAFTNAVNAIPRTTPAETAIGNNGFAQLERMRQVKRADVPLVVALNDALINGRYSRQAFQYMVSQLDPATLRGIFTGPRGGGRSREAVFRRLRAEFGFRQAVMGSMDVMSAAHLRPGGRVAARGVAGVLLAVEIGNLVAQGIQSYRVSQTTAQRRNIAPFLRRIAFWRQLRAQPAAVAVKDPTFGSTTYERDPGKIDTGLQNNDWDFLYIEHTAQRPALSDIDILHAMLVLGYQVRNYDEYATLFEDSDQDAITYNNGGRPWSQARWMVRVGAFDTSGENHIEARWEEIPLLTEGMNALTRRVISNTDRLLELVGQNRDANTQEMGTLQTPEGRVLYKARLKPGITQTIVTLRPRVPPQWAGRSEARQPIHHRVTWQTNSRPVFYVWEVQDTVEIRVSGADFATYYRLRDLRSKEYSVGSRGDTLNALLERDVRNQQGDGWILISDIERI